MRISVFDDAELIAFFADHPESQAQQGFYYDHVAVLAHLSIVVCWVSAGGHRLFPPELGEVA